MDTIDINTNTLLINTFINYNKCEFPHVSSKQIVYVEIVVDFWFNYETVPM